MIPENINNLGGIWNSKGNGVYLGVLGGSMKCEAKLEFPKRWEEEWGVKAKKTCRRGYFLKDHILNARELFRIEL